LKFYNITSFTPRRLSIFVPPVEDIYQVVSDSFAAEYDGLSTETTLTKNEMVVSVTARNGANGTFDRIKANQPLQPAPRLAGLGLFAGMVQGLRHHHFGIQKAAPGDLPHQHPEVPIGVVHHRSHTEAITGLAVLLHPPMLPSRVP